MKDLKLPGACPECGGSGYFRQELPVGHPDFGRPVACACRMQTPTPNRPQRSQLEGRLLTMSFDNFQSSPVQQAALRAARKFSQKPVAWLTLWGDYGRGKTHLLAAVINACRANNIPADYYTLPDLLDRLRHSYTANSPFFETVRTIPVLALDEIDQVYLTDWARQEIYRLADARYRSLEEQGTLFALNQNPRTLLEGSGDTRLAYLFSRMADQHSQVIYLPGSDARPVARALRGREG